MQAKGLQAKRHRAEVDQTDPDGAQTQNFYSCAGRFPAIATVKEIRPCVQTFPARKVVTQQKMCQELFLNSFLGFAGEAPVPVVRFNRCQAVVQAIRWKSQNGL